MAKWALILAIILPLFLASCDRAAAEAEDIDFARYFANRDLFIGETLTISMYQNSLYGRVTETIAWHYMRENPGVYIEVVLHATRAGFIDTVTTQLLAGAADTLIMADAMSFVPGAGAFAHFRPMDWQSPRISHLFADFFPIIEAVPDFDEADWYMAGLNAMAIDGRLIAFPKQFVYSYFTANRNVPGLAEAFGQHQSISLETLLDLHGRFAPEGMLLYPAFNPTHAMPLIFNNHFDSENQMVDFYNQTFIDLLNDLRALTSPPDASDGIYGRLNRDSAFSHRYLFDFRDLGTEWRNLPLAEDELIFINPIPEIDCEGNLLLTPFLSFALNAGATPAQQALAFDFIQFMLRPESLERFGAGIFSYKPIHRHSFRYHTWRNIPSEDRDQLTETATARQNQLAQIPATMRYRAPIAIQTILAEVLGQFTDGLIDARQTAELLQNRISIVLMEMD